MNRVKRLGVNRAHLVHRLTQHIEHASQSFVAYRDHDGMAQALRAHPANQALRGLHRDGAHAALADVLLRFTDDVDRLWNFETFAGDADGRL